MSDHVPLIKASDLEALMRIPSTVSDRLLAALEAVRLDLETEAKAERVPAWALAS
jgi:hypothetical protein